MDGWMDGRMVDGCMDGWMAAWMEGWMGGWMGKARAGVTIRATPDVPAEAQVTAETVSFAT